MTHCRSFLVYLLVTVQLKRECRYDMYTGDAKSAVSHGNDLHGAARLNADGQVNSESGPALELIEMANGETIW
jgi:hypothetical protein